MTIIVGLSECLVCHFVSEIYSLDDAYWLKEGEYEVPGVHICDKCIARRDRASEIIAELAALEDAMVTLDEKEVGTPENEAAHTFLMEETRRLWSLAYDWIRRKE